MIVQGIVFELIEDDRAPYCPPGIFDHNFPTPDGVQTGDTVAVARFRGYQTAEIVSVDIGVEWIRARIEVKDES